MSRAQNFLHRRLVLCLLALLFVPISGRAAECDDMDIQITTTPVFPQFTLGLHQHFEQMRQVPTGPIDLLLVGDSLVWGWDPHAWGKGGEGKSIWGFGAVGDRTQNVLWRLQGDDLKKLAPKNVLLLIGTNNLGAVDKPCAVLAGFEAIVHRMRELWSPFRLLIADPPAWGELAIS